MGADESRCIVTRHPTTPARPGLTLEVDATADADLSAVLWRLPERDRHWDEGSGRWFVAPAHLAQLLTLAVRFRHAWLVDTSDGSRVNLHTGERHEQLGLSLPAS